MRQTTSDFLAHQQALGKSPRSLDAYRAILRYFRQHLARVKVSGIHNVAVQHVRDYHDALIARKLATETRRAYLATIQNFFRWAYRHKRILTDVAQRIEIPEKESGLPPVPLTEEDVATLLDAVSVRTVTGKRDRALLETLYACALRREEAMRMNVGDVDAAERTLFVRGKGGKQRLVPIHAAALQAIAAYLAARGGNPRKTSPLFATQEGKRLTGNNIDRLFYILNRKSRKHVHPHLLRHSCACHLLKNGVDLRYVQALLGHSSPDMTSRYLGIVKEDLKAVYDAAMERILDTKNG